MSLFDALSLKVETPHRVLLLLPNGEEWKDADGKQAYIDVLSTDSDKNAEASREISDRRMNGEEFSGEAEMRARLPFLTCGWYLLNFAGQMVSDTYSLEAARDLYSGRARDFITRQVVAGAFNPSNFMPAPPSA